MVDEDATKDELQEELRRRDLPVSGTKAELEQRLRDQGGDESTKRASSSTSSGRASKEQGASKKASGGSRSAPTQERRDGVDRREAPSEPPTAGGIARLAARQLGALTRRQVEGISGLGRDENGWRVEVEVVEVDRVPSSTDVMGTYAVYVDAQGELLSYERVERFVRGQASGGES